ncbi:MAG TPA: peptide chain release factor N(5)-glutamine methyltransferase [Chryseolinea sp.]|nr:peptide chain release factor N(5)-glutamine methyltransferase [Chryseolinea sp.]
MNSKVLFNDLVKAITIDESVDEIQAMVYIILENTLTLSRTDVLAERDVMVVATDDELIKSVVRRINSQEPIQYVFGWTEFYGRKFKVNPDVLIPRPETEELVSMVKEHIKGKNISDPRILDVGTGSGCIAVTLALEIRGSKVFATDISQKALETARQNATALNSVVGLFNNNIVDDDLPVKALDVVVSNPPYIPLSEKQSMKNNVTRFEPSQALFVSDVDPLVFYRAIATKASKCLGAGGLLAVEINERFGSDVARIFKDSGFEDVRILNDVFHKERIVKGQRA